jgi:hypothetical protein
MRNASIYTEKSTGQVSRFLLLNWEGRAKDFVMENISHFVLNFLVYNLIFMPARFL